MQPAEFTALLRRHRGLLYRVAFAYCRSASDRDDVVQEIAAQLWRSRDRYDPSRPVTTWMYRIAVNVAISHYRRERRHVEGVTLLDDSHLSVAAPESAHDIARLLREISVLDPLDRALVVLYLDGNDHATTAEILGISTSNVGTKLARIKHQLRAAFALEQESFDGERNR